MKKSRTITTHLLLLVLLVFFSSSSVYALDDVIKIKVTEGQYFDETIIRFLPDATPEFDSNYDAWKRFSGSTEVPSIYSFTSDQLALAINALPSLPAEQSGSEPLAVVPFEVMISKAETHTLESIVMGAFGTGIYYTLTNEETGEEIPFPNGTIYQMNMGPLDVGSIKRFSITFRKVPTITSAQAKKSQNINMHVSYQKLIIDVPESHATARFILLDNTGRQLLSQPLHAYKNEIAFTPEIKNGIYIVVIKDIRGMYTRKFHFKGITS